MFDIEAFLPVFLELRPKPSPSRCPVLLSFSRGSGWSSHDSARSPAGHGPRSLRVWGLLLGCAGQTTPKTLVRAGALGSWAGPLPPAPMVVISLLPGHGQPARTPLCGGAATAAAGPGPDPPSLQDRAEHPPWCSRARAGGAEGQGTEPRLPPSGPARLPGASAGNGGRRPGSSPGCRTAARRFPARPRRPD